MPAEAAAPPASPNVPVAPDAPQSATVEAPFNDAFAELDKMISSEPDEKPVEDKPKAPEKPVDKPKETKAKPDERKTGDDLRKGKEGDEKQPPAGAGDGNEVEKPAGKKTPWQLVHQYEAEIATLRKDLEGARGGSPKDHPDFKSLQERFDATNKRAEELESKIKFISYKDSQEFKDKYEKPYVDAWINGRSRVAAMTFTDPDSGEERRGTPEDFDRLMRIGSEDDAADFATRHFGNKASGILYHRERVQELSGQADKAVEEYRTKGSEQEKLARDQHETFVKSTGSEVGKLWEDGIKAATEKYPQWSKAVDGDDEGNQLLERGVAMANKAFASFNVFDPKLSKEQRAEMVKLHTALFNKAAWFDRLALADSRKGKRIVELEKQLQDYKASEPGTGTARKPKGAALDVPGWEAQLEGVAT
jgi:hypothetical protein